MSFKQPYPLPVAMDKRTGPTHRVVLLPYTFLILCGFLFLSHSPTFAQQDRQTDTVITSAHSPHKATIYSAILPGLGQAYNRKYWKIPIIYGGFATLGYFIHTNTKEYHKFRDAYNYVSSGDTIPINNDYVSRYTLSGLQQGRNYYRRNMELTYILSAALYILNILDATVDAHLTEFDVGEDLSLKIQPGLIPGAQGQAPRASLSLTLRF